MPAPKPKPKLSPLSHLQGVLMVLDKRSSRPTAEMLGTIREMVSDAMLVLQEPDPAKQRLAFVLLVIQQSTSVKTKVIGGKQINKVTVSDQPLYAWAIAEIHAMAGAA